MKQLLLIVNAHSGRADIRNKLVDVLDIFIEHGFLPTVVTTQHAGHATELVRNLGGGFDRIICCGGDGTVNETLNGLMTLDPRPPLGILPVGSVNDYAHSLSIPSVTVRAAEVAAGEQYFPIDVGILNGRFFNYVAAFGLFTDVPYETAQDAKNIFGPVAYVLEGAKRISQIKHNRLRLEHDGGVINGDFLVGLFSNSVSIAGMRHFYKDALLDDGLLEICLVKRPHSLAVMQDVLNVLLDFKQVSDLNSEFVIHISTRKAVVTSTDPLSWTVDGENGGLHTTTIIEARQKAVTVIAGGDMTGHSAENKWVK